MPKGRKQKLKLYYLYQIMTNETDENHELTVREIQKALEQWDVTADRKTLYDDF